MADVNGPLIVRHSPPTYSVKPGLHTYNSKRQPTGSSLPAKPLQYLRTLLLLLGLCGLGYYGYTLANQYIYQDYQNWAFDQEIAGRRQVNFRDYLREQTPFGFLAGAKPAEPVVAPAPPSAPEVIRPVQGSLLGRVEVPRLNLSAMVREGVDAKTLSVAVGHVPSTALAGQPGNFAIAAHRDTLFRALKDIRKDDLIEFQSTTGTYTYKVMGMTIVKPSNVSVLRPDGGGVIPAADLSSGNGPDKLLTMITCYPFYYVGAAPKRFIVEAKLVSSDSGAKLPLNEAQNVGPPSSTRPEKVMHSATPKAIRRASLEEPRSKRGSSRIHRSHERSDFHSQAANRPVKRHGFWHKLFHAS